MGRITSGFWARGSKLVGVATKVALSEIGTKLKGFENEKDKLKARLELAQSLVKTLSELKGASMKVGQLLSMDLGEIFPPEVIKVLESLHQNSTFLPFKEIEDILKNELKEKFSDFESISENPIAAASIGQVHAAKLGGQDVVIKLQYPGVADTIPQDLKILEVLLSQLVFLTRKDVDFKPILKEIEQVLIQEIDYQLEAEMMTLYGEKFRPNYIVPKVFQSYSTHKIITMERLEGKNFNLWLGKSKYGERQKLAQDLMELYLQEFFTHGLVQTDPNPGNFLITEQNQLALLDFGAVKKYNDDFIQGYRRVLTSAYKGDQESLLEESYRLGFIDSRENVETKNIYLNMMDLLCIPFRRREAFNFGDKEFYENSRNLSWELTRKCQFSPPPKDLIFLHRKLGGIFFLIKKLDVPISLNDYWDRFVDPQELT